MCSYSQFTALQMLRMKASPSAWALKEPSWSSLALVPWLALLQAQHCVLFPAPLQYASFPLPPIAALHFSFLRTALSSSRPLLAALPK